MIFTGELCSLWLWVCATLLGFNPDAEVTSIMLPKCWLGEVCCFFGDPKTLCLSAAEREWWSPNFCFWGVAWVLLGD